VGIVNRATAPNRLLWLRDVAPETHPFGPYVNPSHFGGAMELIAPWLLGYGLAATMRIGDADRKPPGGVLALIGAGVAAAATVFAASKMAVATIGVSYAVLIAIAAISGRGRSRLILMVGTGAAALLVGVIAMTGPLRGRIDDFVSTHSGALSQSVRGFAWTGGLRLADDFRWTGCGFGAVGDLLPAYLPRGESGDWSLLHNDYLELYASGGAVAVLLVAWLTVAFVRRVWRVARREAASGRLLPTMGLIFGLVALAVHESVDFNLQVPANALLFVVLAAMCVSPFMRPAEGS
jgi:O-antigen ligase